MFKSACEVTLLYLSACLLAVCACLKANKDFLDAFLFLKKNCRKMGKMRSGTEIVNLYTV